MASYLKNKVFNQLSTSDLLLTGLGLAGAILLLLVFPQNHIYEAFDTSFSKQSAEIRSKEILKDLGYQTRNEEVFTRYQHEADLLDSLQNRLGRRRAVSLFKSEGFESFPVTYWRTALNRGIARDNSNDGDGNMNLIDADLELYANEAPIVELTERGQWMGLYNPELVQPSKPIRTGLLLDLFSGDNPGLQQKLEALKSKNLTSSDSSYKALINFDFKHALDESGRLNASTPMDSTIYLGPEHAVRIAEAYMANTIWSGQDMALDTVKYHASSDGHPAHAEVRFSKYQEQFDQQVTLRASVTPGGALLHLQPSYPLASGSSSDIWPIVRFLLIFLLGFISIVLFYTRIRSRAIDTKATLISALIGCLLLPALLILQIFKVLPYAWEHLDDSSGFLVAIFLLAVISSLTLIMFFILIGVGDSITRQNWPEKLQNFDQLRQGNLFNKAFGVVAMRSLLIALTLGGLTMGFLLLLPHTHLVTEDTLFYSYTVKFPPLYSIISSLFSTLLVGITIFLVIGSKLYSLIKKHWLPVAGITLLSGILGIFPIELAGEVENTAAHAALGFVSSLIFIRYDALSLLGGLFLFSMLMWVPLSFPEGSPDAAIAPVNISIFILAGLYGLAAWVWGTDTRELPSYVPEYIKELAMEERIKQELDIAREVQQSFLPKVTPQLSDLDIAALCEPAYETGGDYYDVIKLDENRIAVTIGDVSGKGIQAAFYMTLVKGILHSLCHEVPNPSELLGKVNRLFYKNAPRGTFISLIYGIIDVRQRTFTFARAGHNPILHWSPNNSLHEHQPCGMGLGLDEGELFDQYIEECTIELKKDDVFVLYTDGVVEALNPMREPYGMERLGSLVTNYATYSAREQLQFLNKDVSRFIGRASQHDDLTLLVIKMNQ